VGPQRIKDRADETDVGKPALELVHEARRRIDGSERLLEHPHDAELTLFVGAAGCWLWIHPCFSS
jgi:hypothetical protein